VDDVGQPDGGIDHSGERDRPPRRRRHRVELHQGVVTILRQQQMAVGRWVAGMAETKIAEQVADIDLVVAALEVGDGVTAELPSCTVLSS